MFYIDHTNLTYSLPIKVHLKPRESNLWAYFSWRDHVLRWIDNDHLCSVEYRLPRKR